MRFIRGIHADKDKQGKPTISFEFFPFKTPEGEKRFFCETLPSLAEIGPDYASVTYGAGGSTRRERELRSAHRGAQAAVATPGRCHLTAVPQGTGASATSDR